MFLLLLDQSWSWSLIDPPDQKLVQDKKRIVIPIWREEKYNFTKRKINNYRKWNFTFYSSKSEEHQYRGFRQLHTVPVLLHYHFTLSMTAGLRLSRVPRAASCPFSVSAGGSGSDIILELEHIIHYWKEFRPLHGGTYKMFDVNKGNFRSNFPF